MTPSEPKLLVFTATYNESGNISPLLDGIWSAAPLAQVLVIDDGSPDGTGKVLDAIARKNSNLIVKHRPGKMGVGSAHREALLFARETGYDTVISLDADFSHDPLVISKIMEALKTHEFVIGSRFIAGGRLDYRGFRRLISWGANRLARAALGIRFRETTTSFRGFTKSLLKRLPIELIQSEGYSFFLECSYFVGRTTKRVLEIPIHFQDRRFGQSKISQSEIYNGFFTLFRLFSKRLFGFFTLQSKKTSWFSVPEVK